MSEKSKAEWSPELDKENDRAVWAHTIPFLAWLLMMSVLGDPSGMRYLYQTVGGLILLMIFRPWRWYARPQLKNIPLSIGIGVLVFVLWVGLESALVKNAVPQVSEFYERYFVELMRFGQLREPLELGENGLHHYDPRTTGWPLFWVHMLGTTIVIGAIEEFMFRGFLYRWMQGSPFFKIDIGKMNGSMCMLVAVIFALEHNEWLMGILCGLLYTWLMVRTRDIWAPIWAHALTNGLLGWYAVQTGSYWFW
ncbi:MAG: CAAX prenyl protease-related protein [Kiritimatiellaceae bacterium]|nr:CAAX prenyl protease-related protein [Kiritimatiellaceae bacterium]